MPRQTRKAPTWAGNPRPRNPQVLIDLLRGLHHNRGPLNRAALLEHIGMSASQLSRVTRFHCGVCDRARPMDDTEPCPHVSSLSDEKLHRFASFVWSGKELEKKYAWLLREYDAASAPAERTG